MKEKLLFETVQCVVRIYDSGQEIVGERLYVVSSYHRKNEKQNIRFATRKQLYSLLVPYRFSILGYRVLYDRFLEELKYEAGC